MQTLRSAVIAMGLLLALAAPAAAGPLEDAQSAEQRGEQEKNIEAERGIA